jgi:glycine C-acetyltransferase
MPRPLSSLLPLQAVALAGGVAPRQDVRLQLVEGGNAQRPQHFEPSVHSAPGRNFAVQDYLGLATHPAIRAAAISALGKHRLCAPGVPAFMGLTAPVLALEDRIAEFLQLPVATAYASGSDAIRVTLGQILHRGDDVIVDAGAHSAVFETIAARQARVHRSPAGLVEAVERRLVRLSQRPGSGRVYVVVSAVSAHGSQIADLAELCALARSHGATLIVDASHDLGAMGLAGGGVMEIQGCTGRVDIVVGSFAKCFGAAGGYAAFRDPAMKQVLRPTQWRSAALSPVNASAILAAIDLADSPEGRRRRRRLHGTALRLRNHLMADGLRVMGQPSPLVPIRLPPMTALPRTALLESAGPLVTLLRAPVVAAHAPRWRIQLTAEHSLAEIDDLAELIRDVTRAFDRQPRPALRVRPLTPSPQP